MQQYTTKDVGALLHVPPETVRRWVREGRLEADRSHGKRTGNIISEEQLMDFLAENPKYGIWSPAEVSLADVLESLIAQRNALNECIDAIRHLLV